MEKIKKHVGGDLAEQLRETLLPWEKRLRARPLFGTLSLCALDFATALLLSNACFLESFAPLGAAYAAACACGQNPGRMREGHWMVLLPGAAGVLGAVSGSLIFAHGEPLRYIAACAILLAAGIILRETVFFRKRWFLPSVTAFALFSTGIAFALTSDGLIPSQPMSNIMSVGLLLCETLLGVGTAILYDLFRRGMRPWAVETLTTGTVSGKLGGWELERTERVMRTSQRAACIGGIASFCAVLYMFPSVLGIRLGNLLAAVCVLSVAGMGSLSAGAAGLLFGLSLDLSRLSVPVYAAIYGLCGLFAGLYRRRSAFSVALAYTAVNALTLVWQPEPKAAFLEGFAASVLFLLFSGRLTALGQLLFPPNSGHGTGTMSVGEEFQGLRKKLDSLSAALMALGKLWTASAGQGDSEISAFEDESDSETGEETECFLYGKKADSAAFHAAAERVCKDCTLRESCWEEDNREIHKALNETAARILHRGRAAPEDFSPYFAAHCVRMPEFLAALNEALAALNYRKRLRKRFGEDNRLLCAQYDGMIRVLGDLMDEFRTIPVRDERLSARLTELLSTQGWTGTADVFHEASGRMTVRVTDTGTVSRNLPGLLRQASRTLGRTMTLCAANAWEGEEGQVLRLREREVLKASVGVGKRPKEGEVLCGDTSLCFRISDGRLCLLISDGMGTGSAAERQSASLARLLEGFLKAGIRPQTALRLVCPAFALRTDGETFASVDLLIVDLYSGEAEFYKCGAAPSYILSAGGPLRRITSAALPAGLFAPGSAEAERTATVLDPGDVIVLASDGVTAGEDMEFTRVLLRKAGEEGNVGKIASALMNTVESPGDDATVLVLKLESRQA